MKSTNRLLILMAIILLSMNQCAIGQGEAQTTIVTLYVNTADINASNRYDNCYLIAVSPGKAPISSGTGKKNIENFFIDVDLGDTVFWNGISSNAPGIDSVCIKKIIHKGGPPIFSQDPSGNCTVEGKTEVRAPRNNKYSYQIQFTVGANPNPFIIDPKIKVN